jgi:hypothetical protein
MQPPVRTPSASDARIAGALWFAWLMMGCVRSVYIEFTIVGGDPATRFARIAENAMIFRLGMLADIATGVLIVFAVLAMYRLLSPLTSRAYLVLGGLLVAPLFFINALNDFAVLLFAQGDKALAALAEPERYSFSWFFLRMHILSKEVGVLLWGLLVLVPFGVLAYRTRLVPRVLAAVLVADGIARLVCAAWFVLPAADANRLVTSLVAIFLFDNVVALWLLFRGVPPANKLRPEAA